VGRTLEAVDPAFFTGRRVLVTGGHGFLGRNVVAGLRVSGAEIIAPRRAEFDLTEQAAVRALMASARPQQIIHLAAACGGIGANVANPGKFLYENAVMGLHLLEAARLNGVDKLILISTTCAYPQDAPLPLNEDSLWDGKPTGATGPYGMAKRLLHEAVDAYGRQYGQRGIVLLPANLYGPEDHFDPAHSHVVAALIRRYVEASAARVPEVVNWGSGTPSREFLHVRDAARGILMAAARHDDAGPVNLGTGVETPIRALAETIAAAADYTGITRWDTSKPDGQPRRVLDVSRAKAFGFQAKIPLDHGIAETVAWFRDNRP
jgi:GDP-L-fucose synthase